MATITYPAMNLAPKRSNRSSRRKNASDAIEAHTATIATLTGLGVMALAGAASVKWKRPEIAIGGLLAAVLAAGVAFERSSIAR